MMTTKRQELQAISSKLKFKHEYDSDEEYEDGTWEHKMRRAEQEATKGNSIDRSLPAFFIQ